MMQTSPESNLPRALEETAMGNRGAGPGPDPSSAVPSVFVDLGEGPWPCRVRPCIVWGCHECMTVEQIMVPEGCDNSEERNS